MPLNWMQRLLKRQEAECRPDIDALLPLLWDPAFEDELFDTCHALLRCTADEVPRVQEALLRRAAAATNELSADTLGEALGYLWAEHGPPAPETLARLTGISWRLAAGTLVALRQHDTQWIAELLSEEPPNKR
jgi:hypothetical protein